MATPATDLKPLAERALALVPVGATVGLGSGKAATAFLHALAAAVANGFHAVGVPTSNTIAELARSLDVPVTSLDDVAFLDIAIDGADEVDPAGNLIKGYGGALVREKIVATAAKRFVILVGEEKIVPVLGHRGTLPVEVIPFAVGPVSRAMITLGLKPRMRLVEEQPFVSDNGNRILDCGIGPLANPAALDASLRAIPGVVGTGLFLGMKPTVMMQTSAGVVVRS